MSQLQNEIRDVNVHQREEERVWKPDGRSKTMNAEMKTGVYILSFFWNSEDKYKSWLPLNFEPNNGHIKKN